MLSIIIPTYNEAENLEEFIRILEGSLVALEYEIIIVDDNSPDGTGTLAELLNKRYNNISVIHRPKKIGFASAIIEGARVSRGDVIITLDADFQHPIEYLPIMVEKINKFDIVIGSRYISGGRIEGLSLY